MKTVKLIALAIFSLAVLNSCTEENQGDPYYDYENPEKWYTENLTVKAVDWKLVGRVDEIDSYYEYIFDGFPYTDGIINVYMYQNYGTNSEIQVPLPYTQYKVEILDDNSEIYYSVQYSYDIAKDGTIALKIYISDYYTGAFATSTEYFRVAIIY
ncbi:MAG: hypothetical protein LBD76_08895 [Prevotellaceae bacterium]|jgi:hypothetical protein|nr:hypothetical protein [Prevotellaceae bacterium]